MRGLFGLRWPSRSRSPSRPPGFRPDLSASFRADIQRAGAILVDEAAKSEGDSEATCARRWNCASPGISAASTTSPCSTRMALWFSATCRHAGHPDRRPGAPGSAAVAAGLERTAGARDFCRPPARRRRRAAAWAQPSGGLRPAGDALRALAIALLPTILLILAIGAVFARRATQRFERVNDAIVRIMNGDLDLRLPVTNEEATSTRSPAPSTSCSTRSPACSSSSRTSATISPMICERRWRSRGQNRARA